MKNNYGSRNTFTGLTGLLCCILLVFAGCKEEKGTSLYDLVTPGKPQPVIDSISPAGSALAASQSLTMYGKNFSATPIENFVFFSGKQANVLSATTTKLVVTSLVDSGSVVVKVTVAGADLYSPNFPYRLYLAVEPFGTLTPPSTGASGLTPDSAGNLYFDLLATGVDNGISIYAPGGTMSSFAPKTPSITYWSSLKKGPGGVLYAARGASAVFVFAGAGVGAAIWVRGSASFSDIDFDQSKNIWAGGNSVGLFCYHQDKTFNSVPYTNSVHALRVYGGYLYFSALVDSTEKILRAPINADTLGAIETYFNIGSAVGSGYVGQAITFSSDGYLYIGTQAPLGIIVVAPDRSFTTPYTLYSSRFGTQVNYLAWGPGELLYGSTYEGGLFKIHTRKSGAPYYGLN